MSKAIKKTDKFVWTDECEKAFQEMKAYIGTPSLLSKPKEGGMLYVYLTISKRAVSAVLVREEDKVQWPIFYVSKALLDAKTRYTEIEKLSLSLSS